MKPEYITSLDLHVDISEAARRKLESNGCSCWLQPRDSKFKPLWHIVFPPGTRVQKGELYAGRLTESLITIPTGFSFIWIQNKQGERVWNTCSFPTGPVRGAH